MQSRFVIRVLSVLSISLGASTATADQQTVVVPFGPVPIGASVTVQVPRFDSTQGALRVATIVVQGRVGGTWAFENTGASAQTVGGYSSSQWIGAHIPVSLPVGVMPPPNPGFPGEVTALAAYDGATDFAGASGISIPFAGQAGDGGPDQQYVAFTEASVAFYGAGGTFDAVLGPMARFGPSHLPPGVQDGSTVVVSGFVRAVYVYDAPTAAICRGSLASNCPCGNAGLDPRGCNNSIDGGGGLLAATGTASIANDTLALAGSGMTNSNALYFQGTAFQYVGTAYGDGLRCVTGTVVRLGTKTNVVGASSYPAPADPRISVRGGVVAPGTRAYQVIYRDGGSFCTSSQFNATNGLLVLWQP